MEPLHPLRTLKRHWRLLLVCTLLGGLLGYAATLLNQGPSDVDNHYIATHVLTVSAPSGDEGGGVNLEKAAFLATTGDVAAATAAEVGMEPTSLLRVLTADPRPQLALLEISATGTDPNQVVLIADTAANELVSYLNTLAQVQLENETDRINSEMVEIEQRIENELTPQCNALPPDERTFCEAQIQDLAEQHNQLQDELDQAQRRAEQAASLVTLQTAQPVPISGPEFDAAIKENTARLTNEAPDTKPGKAETNDRPAVQQRIEAAAPDGPNAVAFTALGAFLGLLTGIGGVFLFDRLDPRLHTKEQAEAAFGFPVLSEVPPLSRSQQRHREVLAFDAPRSRAAEAYRTVRSALRFLDGVDAGHGVGANAAAPHPSNGNGATANGSAVAATPPRGADATTTGDPKRATSSGNESTPAATPAENPDPLSLVKQAKDAATPPAATAESPPAPPPAQVDRRGKIILVTSPGPAEGKTTTVANLAAVIAETGASVLVINCDFRRPTLHEFLGAEPIPRRVVDTVIPRVRMVPNVVVDNRGANPAEVVAEQRKLALAARKHFDVVVLDTAPILSTNDAADVLPVADQVVVVARAGKTTGEAADRAAEQLERLGAPVAGVILVGARSTPGSRYYYYYENDAVRPDRSTLDDEALDRMLEGAILRPER